MITATPAGTSKGPDLGLLVAVMGENFTARARKALTVYMAASAVWSVSKTWWHRGEAGLTYTVTVDSGDDLYADVHAWVLARVPPKRQRSLVARSQRVGTGLVAPEGGTHQGDEPAVQVFYDGRRTQVVQVGPHRVRVSVEQEEVGRVPNPESGWGAWRRDRVVFTTIGAAGRDAVLEVLRELATRRTRRRHVSLFMPRWGEDWCRSGEMPPRPLDSVVLAAGAKEDLVGDLGQFLGDEAAYNRLGLPWHRGYLLTGPPGTGKTSVAKALAQHFRLDVYYLPLSAVPNDSALARLLGNVPARSLLLIEDVDIAHGARQRDDSERGVTLSGLLNGLDGVMTPHGLVTVLTTNDDKVIDDALLREGRVDQRFHLGYLDDDQLERLVGYGLGQPVGRLPRIGEHQLSPAAVVEVLKGYLDHPGDVFGALQDLVLGAPSRGCVAQR